MVRDAKIGNPTAKEVLKCIADQSNDSGRGVWSSIAYFVFSTERDRSTVKRALTFLQDEDFIDHVAWTTYGTHLWKMNLEKLESVMRVWRHGPDDMDADDIEFWGEQSEPGAESTEGRGRVNRGEGQTAPQAPNNPDETLQEEPTYVDDIDGVPDERQMEWLAFLEGWKKSFPDKAQPRKTNTALRNKFYTRLKDEGFRAKWRSALWSSRNRQFLHDEGWFKAKWFLHNNDNYEKLLDGTFDFKEKQQKKTGHVTRPGIVDARPKEAS
jgi:hypothetical protein